MRGFFWGKVLGHTILCQCLGWNDKARSDRSRAGTAMMPAAQEQQMQLVRQDVCVSNGGRVLSVPPIPLALAGFCCCLALQIQMLLWPKSFTKCQGTRG